MIKGLLKEAATIDDSGFVFIENIEGFSFYKKIKENNKRFLIVYEADSLQEVNYYNNTIKYITPIEIKSEPAFERNSDLIILLNLKNLGDFNTHEQKIFSIEEDPYYFKKYVLYYSDEEVNLLANKSISDLREVILDRNLFNAYKTNPNYPSLYSFAARFFIKVPFLHVPVNEEEMPSIEVMLKESLLANDLVTFDDNLTKIINDKGDHSKILKEFENE
ncbi:ABC-three component system middle component 1 [Pseudoalteromonas sp.]|uniref:ABC-three component system middle component 1 n=1 Tax=Pseudoalteromonas sp. TaxID=53249 RepID=UPI002353302E|nr:ABC-three component system middle component 1 [Pseudoalteromonas sp.]